MLHTCIALLTIILIEFRIFDPSKPKIAYIINISWDAWCMIKHSIDCHKDRDLIKSNDMITHWVDSLLYVNVDNKIKITPTRVCILYHITISYKGIAWWAACTWVLKYVWITKGSRGQRYRCSKRHHRDAPRNRYLDRLIVLRVDWMIVPAWIYGWNWFVSMLVKNKISCIHFVHAAHYMTIGKIVVFRNRFILDRIIS